MLSSDAHLVPWTELPWAAIDVETTGFYTDDRIIEIAVVRFERGRVIDEWSTLVDPGRDVPYSATRVHGISTFALRDAPRFIDAVPHIVRLAAGAVPVAYNASFDRRMLMREADALRLDAGVSTLFDDSWPWIDPLPWARSLNRFVEKKGSKDNKLPTICERWGITLDRAHSAKNDARATGELLWAMAPRIGRMTATELLRRQRLAKDAHTSRTGGST